VNDIQQVRAMRKICGWFGIVDNIGANVFAKLLIEVVCRDSILREFHFDIVSGTNDFSYSSIYIL
jgi:hypothetical protein